MIHLIIGNDTTKRREARNTIIERLGGDDHFSIVRIDGNEIELGAIKDALSSQDLFGKKMCVIVHGGSRREEIKQVFSEMISRFEVSDDVLIIEEDSILKPMRTMLDSHGAIVQEFSKQSKKEMPIIFALADACLGRDKKSAWIEFMNVKDRGIAPEEIHGILWWQFKMLFLSFSKKEDLTTLSLSPYVLNKVKLAQRTWKHSDVAHLLDRLIDMFHESRRGKLDLMLELELFVLEAL